MQPRLITQFDELIHQPELDREKAHVAKQWRLLSNVFSSVSCAMIYFSIDFRFMQYVNKAYTNNSSLKFCAHILRSQVANFVT